MRTYAGIGFSESNHSRVKNSTRRQIGEDNHCDIGGDGEFQGVSRGITSPSKVVYDSADPRIVTLSRVILLVLGTLNRLSDSLF